MNMFYVVIVTLLIITLFFYIHHTASMLNLKKNGGRIIIEDTFTFEVKPKSEYNDYYNHGSKDCFYINDRETPILHFKEGKYYELVNKSTEPLYFSKDEAGGKETPGKCVKDFKGQGMGTIYFKASRSLPKEFFYQSGESEYMGGRVKIS